VRQEEGSEGEDMKEKKQGGATPLVKRGPAARVLEP